MGYSAWGHKEPNMAEKVGTHAQGLYATFYTSPQLQTLLPLLGSELFIRVSGRADEVPALFIPSW